MQIKKQRRKYMKRKLKKYIAGFEGAWKSRTSEEPMFKPFITTAEKDGYVEIQMWLPADDIAAFKRASSVKRKIIDIKNFRRLKRSLETGIGINEPYIKFAVGNHPRQKGKTLAYYICNNIICIVKKKNDNSQLGNFSGAAQCTHIVNKIIEDELESKD